MTHSVYVISSAAGNFAAVVDVPNTCSANDDWTLNSKINLQIMIESGIWGSARHLSLCGIFRESALDQSWRDGHRRSEISRFMARNRFFDGGFASSPKAKAATTCLHATMLTKMRTNWSKAIS